MHTLNGIATSPGIALGKVVLLETLSRKQIMQVVTDTEAEFQHVLGAVQIAKKQLTDLYKKAVTDIGEESAVIFNIHATLIEDSEFLNCIHEIINRNSCTGEYAVYAAGKHFTSIFNQMEDEYMRERAADIEDLSHRIARILSGQDQNLLKDISEPVIIAAENLLPSQTFQLEKDRILAFISKKGSMNSHASILARSLGIPSVTALDKHYNTIKNGDYLIIDGIQGLVICDPDPTTILAYQSQLDELNKEKQRLLSLVGSKAVTKDGYTVSICANIGHTDESKIALHMDADGIGLYRSEFLFLENNDFPSEEEQFQAYKEVLENMSPKRVVIRTLDFGSDKQAPYFQIGEEDNPALGYRAIRISLDRTELFIPQLRALLRASVYGNLAIMFPMITCVEEVERVYHIVNSVKIDLQSEGIDYADKIEYGIMIETPAAVMVADRLAMMVDFFSIGTNDLTQYTLACDRMNSKVSNLFDSGNVSVLRMIKHTADTAHRNGIWVGICGESAANKALLPFYIAMGIDELSVSVQSILTIKEAVQGLKQSECMLQCDEFLK